MTDLVVRRLMVDLEQPMARHWCDGDAFRTAWFNALSMSFPVGEQFFIDSVRGGHKLLPPAQQDAFRAEVQGFVGQEATHRHLHSLFNRHLEARGLRNRWEPRARRRLKHLQNADFRHWLAITAGNEHLTALLSDHVLHHPEVLGDTEPRVRTLWQWHCAEESEHKSTAIDLYRALGGNEAWRRTWFRRITLVFLVDAVHQTVDNLRRDGMLWKLSTWRSGASFLFGRHGLLRTLYHPWKQYLREGFHPSQQDSSAAADWLRANADQYVPVVR